MPPLELDTQHVAVVFKTALGSHFGWSVNSPPILEPTLVGIESDVHRGPTDLDFEKPVAMSQTFAFKSGSWNNGQSVSRAYK